MVTIKRNKDFIMRYLNALCGVPKTRELCEKFMTDESLVQHILFFESVFPRYDMFVDEVTAEGNRVILRCRMKGKHEGVMNGIPPTNKEITFPFVIGYEIENEMIVSHWLIADQMLMMEQLGLANQPAS